MTAAQSAEQPAEQSAADDFSEDTPVRAAVFATVEQAEAAVARLHEAGFTDEHISVICSDDAKEAHFRRNEHEDQAGAHTATAAAAGGTLGLLLGGFAALAGTLATGGLALVGAGAVAGAGGVAGSLIGAMLTRGEEGELADFYDQGVREGHLLVGVEAGGRDAPAMLAAAETVFRDLGSRPVTLRDL